MKSIPWWAIILIKILLSRLPVSYYFWKKLGLFKLGKMDDPSYALETVSTHVNLSKKSLSGKCVLEIGPGDSLVSGIIFHYYNASSILIENGNFIYNSLNNFRNLKSFMKLRGIEMIDIPENMEDLCKKHNINFLSEGLKSLKKIKSNSVDIIFSHAVLEHIFENEFEEIFNELHRVIKKSGYMSHKVDFKDHLGGSLNNLRVPKFIWESYLFRNSGFYSNRIQHNEMINIFKKTGFMVCYIEKTLWEKLPIKINKLSKEFQSLSQKDLIVSGFRIKLKAIKK